MAETKIIIQWGSKSNNIFFNKRAGIQVAKYWLLNSSNWSNLAMVAFLLWPIQALVSSGHPLFGVLEAGLAGPVVIALWLLALWYLDLQE